MQFSVFLLFTSVCKKWNLNFSISCIQHFYFFCSSTWQFIFFIWTFHMQACLLFIPGLFVSSLAFPFDRLSCWQTIFWKGTCIKVYESMQNASARASALRFKNLNFTSSQCTQNETSRNLNCIPTKSRIKNQITFFYLFQTLTASFLCADLGRDLFTLSP